MQLVYDIQIAPYCGRFHIIQYSSIAKRNTVIIKQKLFIRFFLCCNKYFWVVIFQCEFDSKLETDIENIDHKLLNFQLFPNGIKQFELSNLPYEHISMR